MITFHAVCYSHHRHIDGAYPIKIKVTFKREHRHIPTNLVAHPSDLTRSLHLKSPQLIAATNNLIDQMRDAVSDLTYFDLQERDCEWIVGHIRKKFTESHFKLNFFEWCKGCRQDKMRDTALRVWSAYAGTGVDINDISAKMVEGFAEYVNGRPNVKRKNTSARYYIIALGAMFDEAKARYNDEDSGAIMIPKSPFQRVRLKAAPAEGQRNLGREVIQQIIDTRCGGKMQYALDMFVVSFALMGANLSDIWNFKEVDGWWVYHRNKTRGRRNDRAEMRVRIPDCIRDRLGCIGYSRYSKVAYATSRINTYLDRWAKDNGVDKFTFYAARHSWASIARSIGIEKATIDECLAHIGDYQVADIYAERNWEAINEANSKVLSLFKW